MSGGPDTGGISLKTIGVAVGVERLCKALAVPRAAKLVSGMLAIALTASAAHEALEIWRVLTDYSVVAPRGAQYAGTRSNGSAVESSVLQTLVSAHLFGAAPASARGRTAAGAQRDTALVLTGTIATPDPAIGLALIGASAEAAHVHPVGDSLTDGAVLRAVYRDHVIVERAGQLTAVFFPRALKGALSTAYNPSRARAAVDAPNREDRAQSERQHIEDTLEAESEHTAAFLRQQPFYSDGQLRGIVLEPGSDPGMLARLGLRAGDVLEHIGESVIAEPDRLDLLRQQLQSGQPVELTVIRPGVGSVDVTIPAGAVAGMIEN